MIEKTLILVKPDGVCQKRIGKVIDRFETSGLQLLGLKLLHLTREDAERFYKEHHGKPFFEGLILFMTAAPIVACVWKGENAVLSARELLGATNSSQALPGTLRRQFGTDNRYNLVHGSDSTASAQREIEFFFKPSELFEYAEQDWKAKSEVTLK